MDTLSMTEIQAFLSYARDDDRFLSGGITKFRETVELGLKVVTGERKIHIFQDVEGIELGDDFSQRIERTIAGSHFFLPIITPLFFGSEACRNELRDFLRHEQKVKRNDLIFPIYFVSAPQLEGKSRQPKDELVEIIAKRQRYDWRQFYGLSRNDTKWLLEVKRLCEAIATAVARTERITPEELQLGNGRTTELFPQNVRETLIQRSREKTPRPLQRVLWVDDQPENNRYEKEALFRYGVEFVDARTTISALQELGKSSFSAIISDMGRPPDLQAGFTLLATLRAEGNQTPFFIYTGSKSPEFMAAAKLRGAQGLTNAPTELIRAVLSILTESK